MLDTGELIAQWDTKTTKLVEIPSFGEKYVAITAERISAYIINGSRKVGDCYKANAENIGYV